jgi:hypothetical protein
LRQTMRSCGEERGETVRIARAGGRKGRGGGRGGWRRGGPYLEKTGEDVIWIGSVL